MSKKPAILLIHSGMIVGATALYAFSAQAGDFALDWSQLDFPAGDTGSVSFTIVDSNGFELTTTFSHTGGPWATTAVAPQTPDDLNLFAGSIEALTIIGDAPPDTGAVGDASIISTMRITTNGTPYKVDGLAYEIHDIDASDNDAFNDRCDFVTVGGDGGIPTLSAVTGTPTYILGPGPGIGLTGPLLSNQAQCDFVDGAGPSPTSNNDLNGTLRVVHPDGTSEASITYDESIGSIRSLSPGDDPYARGISTWGAIFFTSAPQEISLSVTADKAIAFVGETVTYTYTITNDGDLPLNPNQTIVVQDSRLGLVTCPAIVADVDPGETFVCVASTTVTAADASVGSIDTTATAGIGPDGQAFADRLQSKTDAASVIAEVEQPADLSLQKVARSAQTALVITEAREGEAIDWELEISNAGPGSATGIDVSDLIPSGFSYVSDDAASSGTSYDNVTGVWTVGALNAGQTKVLRIRTLVLAAGERTNLAEIRSATTSDPDSDPAASFGTDDLGDGISDDDEASWTVTLIPATRTLSGTVFIDNGAAGGTAHDAFRNGGEVGTNDASVELYDEFGANLAQAVVAADGTWIAEVSPDYAAPLSVVVVPGPDKLTVSESTSGLPALVDSDPSDGTFTFTPLAGSNYSDLNVGLVTMPRLFEDQEAIVLAGQSVLLLHEYHATSDGTVSLAYADVTKVPDGGFTVTLFGDDDCDGVPNAPILASITVVAGDRVCVFSRVVASAAATEGSTVSYGLEALTSFTGITVTDLTANTDLVVVSGAQGQLLLAKTVRNISQSTPEGQSNAGSTGDLLEYRILLSNPSSLAVGGVVVYDQTPAYTRLAAAVPDGISVGGDMTCNVAAPIVNSPGYSGDLRWECIGTMAPGDSGSISFQVEIIQ